MVDALIPADVEVKLAAKLVKALAPLVGALAIAAGGFAAAEVYEHRAPWGLGPKLASAHKAIDSKNLALGRAAQALKNAAAAIAARDGAIARNAYSEAHDAEGSTDFWKGQVHAAFDAGLASCKSGARGAPGHVRDLRDLWSAGAYLDSPGLPSQPGGSDRP